MGGSDLGAGGSTVCRGTPAGIFSRSHFVGARLQSRVDVDRLSVPAVGWVEVERHTQPDADLPRTAQTVFRMEAGIRKGARDRAVQLATREALSEAGLTGQAAPEREHVEAVFDWIQRNVDFREDPPEDELLIEPGVLVRLPRSQRAGDCDDFTMLGGAMLGALGIPSRVVTIKADPRDPTVFSHVYLEALLPGETLAFDASHGSGVGWSAPRVFDSRRWEGLSMLGRLGDACDPIYFDGCADLPSPGGSPSGAGSGGALNQILSSGLRIGEKAATFFFPPTPTYQQVGPGGSTTVWGAGGASPVLLGPTAIPGWVWALGAASLVVMVVAGGRR